MTHGRPWRTSPWPRWPWSRRPTTSEAPKSVWIDCASGRDDHIPPIAARWRRDQQDCIPFKVLGNTLSLFTDGGYGYCRNNFSVVLTAETRLCADPSHARAFAPFPSRSSRRHGHTPSPRRRENRMRIRANAERPEVHQLFRQAKSSRRAPPPGRHFWSRARMGLWSSVRARIDTVSTTVYRSLTAVVRGKSPLFPRVTALSERYTVIDTVSKRARTPLHSPIRARDQKCPSGGGARREIDCCSCEPTVTSKSHGHADRLIDLVLSSSTDDTVRVFTESVVLTSSLFPSAPLTCGKCGAEKRDGSESSQLCS